MVEIKNLTKYYGQKAAVKTQRLGVLRKKSLNYEGTE